MIYVIQIVSSTKFFVHLHFFLFISTDVFLHNLLIQNYTAMTEKCPKTKKKNPWVQGESISDCSPQSSLNLFICIMLLCEVNDKIKINFLLIDN